MRQLLWALIHIFDTTPRIHSNFGNAHKYRMVKHNSRFDWSNDSQDVADKHAAIRRHVEQNPKQSIAEITSYFEDW